jgi:hypothetical protein
MTKSKGAAVKPAAAPKDPDHCAKAPDGVHRWIDEIHGAGRVRTTVQRCQACDRRVTLGAEEV